MKYLITEEIESPAKATKHIEVRDLFFFLGYLALAVCFRGLVHDRLQIPYLLFSALMATVLTMKSFFNKKRRNYESIYLLISRFFSDGIYGYRPIYEKEEEIAYESKEEE